MALDRLLNTLAAQYETNPKSDTKGVLITPYFQLEPSMDIVPLVQFMIGLVNKGLSSFPFSLKGQLTKKKQTKRMKVRKMIVS